MAEEELVVFTGDRWRKLARELLLAADQFAADESVPSNAIMSFSMKKIAVQLYGIFPQETTLPPIRSAVGNFQHFADHLRASLEPNGC